MKIKKISNWGPPYYLVSKSRLLKKDKLCTFKGDCLANKSLCCIYSLHTFPTRNFARDISLNNCLFSVGTPFSLHVVRKNSDKRFLEECNRAKMIKTIKLH